MWVSTKGQQNWFNWHTEESGRRCKWHQFWLSSELTIVTSITAYYDICMFSLLLAISFQIWMDKIQGLFPCCLVQFKISFCKAHKLQPFSFHIYLCFHLHCTSKGLKSKARFEVCDKQEDADLRHQNCFLWELRSITNPPISYPNYQLCILQADFRNKSHL